MDEVKAENAWGDATIKTLLHRLIQKGAVLSRREDGRQRYHAVIDHPDYLAAEVDALIDRLFDGRRDGLRAFLDEA